MDLVEAGDPGRAAPAVGRVAARRRSAPWWAAVFAFVLAIGVERASLPPEPKQNCGTICFTLVQSRAYADGLDPWNGASSAGQFSALDNHHPLCPVVGPSLYTPAYLWMLRPLSDRIGPVCGVWPDIQLAAYALALALAASMLTGWHRAGMLLAVLVVRAALAEPFYVDPATGRLADPFYVDYTSGQTASIEAAALWMIAMLGARGRWWASATLSFMLGIPKQIYWVFVTLPILARRSEVAAAGLVAVFLTHTLAFSLDRQGFLEAIRQATGHDERGAVHPSSRSLVRDWMDSAASGSTRADLPWLCACGLVVIGMLWWARRSPARVASPDGMLLCLLAYLAMTPYLKDYTMVAAVPAVASVVATAPLWGVSTLAVVHYGTGEAGGYHGLLVIWTALLVHALAMRWRPTRT